MARPTTVMIHENTSVYFDAPEGPTPDQLLPTPTRPQRSLARITPPSPTICITTPTSPGGTVTTAVHEMSPNRHKNLPPTPHRSLRREGSRGPRSIRGSNESLHRIYRASADASPSHHLLPKLKMDTILETPSASAAEFPHPRIGLFADGTLQSAIAGEDYTTEEGHTMEGRISRSSHHSHTPVILRGDVENDVQLLMFSKNFKKGVNLTLVLEDFTILGPRMEELCKKTRPDTGIPLVRAMKGFKEGWKGPMMVV